ncbi:YgfZ/GcvT domain-containing protein [Planctomicrobium sp. SH668]|uniref:CAF17-like 4Fe-4S cluster assembly/insertion protein YgfZ n=1 Tax=Planctomicrobium sp. SH668 TaxID=3448126 RepID=UPI003F5C25F8
MANTLSSPESLQFTLEGWTQFEMSGTGAKSFLHNFSTNDINKLDIGKTCEAFVCDIKGRILGHLLVANPNGSLRIFGVPGTAGTIVPHLKKYLLDAPVEIVDRSAELDLLLVTGKQGEQNLAEVLGITSSCSLGECQQVDMPSGSVVVTRTDLLPATALLVSGDSIVIQAIQKSLKQVGVEAGDDATFERLRIGAGFPWYGRDISADDLGQVAARTERAISFTKGCYLGQEPIARLDAMGHTNRELRGFLIESGGAQVGDVLLSGEKEIGKLSSVATLPGTNQSIALGMIRTQFAEVNSQVDLRTASGVVQAKIYWPALAE